MSYAETARRGWGNSWTVPGEISVPTPILSRKRSDLDTRQSQSHFIPVEVEEHTTGEKVKRTKARYLTEDREAHIQLAEQLRAIRKTTDASRYTLYDGLFNGLEALLKITTVVGRDDASHKGPRSLMSMCLRVVPGYIKAVDAHSRMEEDENGTKTLMISRDSVAEVYSGLENMGTSSSGWSHLASVVRAHGVQIVAEAIEDGLIALDFSCALVSLCIHMAAEDEAQVLLTSILAASIFPPPKSVYGKLSDTSATLALSALQSFADYTQRRNYQLRQLTELFTSQRLPLAWLATKDFSHIWTNAIQALSQHPHERESAEFIAKIVPMLCNTTSPATISGGTSNLLQPMNAMLASVLTTLSSISILSDDETIDDRSQQLIETCLLAVAATVTLAEDETSLRRASLLVLSSLLVGKASVHQSKNERWLLHLLGNILGTTKGYGNATSDAGTAAGLICSIARCCGRGSHADGFEHLISLHARIDSLSMCASIDVKVALFDAIIDSAWAFAQQTGMATHLIYAETVVVRYRGTEGIQAPSSRHSADEPPVGFRWEEGISEWVTATPAAVVRKPVNYNDTVAYDDIDIETPFRAKTTSEGYAVGPALNDSAVAISTLGQGRDELSISCILSSSPCRGLDGLDVSILSTGSSDIALPSKYRSRFEDRWATITDMPYSASQQSSILEDSDDELSSLSITIPQASSTVLREITNISRPRRKPSRKQTRHNGRWSKRKSVAVEDSEDELGM